MHHIIIGNLAVYSLWYRLLYKRRKRRLISAMSRMRYIFTQHIKRLVSGLAYTGCLLMSLPSISIPCSADLYLTSISLAFGNQEESVVFQQT